MEKPLGVICCRPPKHPIEILQVCGSGSKKAKGIPTKRHCIKGNMFSNTADSSGLSFEPICLQEGVKNVCSLFDVVT